MSDRPTTPTTKDRTVSRWHWFHIWGRWEWFVTDHDRHAQARECSVCGRKQITGAMV